MIPYEDTSPEIEVLAAGKGRRVAGVDDTYNIDKLPDALAGLPGVVIPRGDWRLYSRMMPTWMKSTVCPARRHLPYATRWWTELRGKNNGEQTLPFVQGLEVNCRVEAAR